MKAFLPLVTQLILLMLFVGVDFALGARARAMGGAFIGLANDENAIFTNPSGLSQLDKTHYHIDVLLNTREDYTNDSFAYATQIYEGTPRKKFSIDEYLENEFQFSTKPKKVSRYNFGVSVNRDMKSKDFISRIMNDVQSNAQLQQTVAAPTETYTVNMAFATRFPMAKSLFQKNEVFGGVNFKFISASRELTSFNQYASKDVMNVSFSTLIKTPHNFSFGGVLDAVISEKLSNWGNTKTSNSNLSVGGSYQLDRDSVFTMDFTNVLNASSAVSPQLRIGFERELIKDELALRLGSWDGTFTMGFGIRFFENMKVDYGFFNGDVLKEHYISAALPF